MSLYDIELKTIGGDSTNLAPYKDKVLLVVNVASKCGFTPQYTGLEALYRKLKDRGFVVLGFPCDQFGNQEPGSNTEIAEFCKLTYDVSFPIFSKIEVNGPGAHPLYAHLKSMQKGLLGTEGIKWNFTKFLVDRSGNVVERIGPPTLPAAIEDTVLRLL